jgi:hypothetical protein
MLRGGQGLPPPFPAPLSLLPVARWHEQIGDPTAADGILDRLVHNAHRIDTARRFHAQETRSATVELTLAGPLSAEAGTRAAAPFPAPLSPPAAPYLRYAPDRFSLTKPNTSCTIEVPASLRSEDCSPSARNAVRVPFGISLRLRRNPHIAHPLCSRLFCRKYQIKTNVDLSDSLKGEWRFVLPRENGTANALRIASTMNVEPQRLRTRPATWLALVGTDHLKGIA